MESKVFVDNIPYEQLWVAIVILAVTVLIQFFLIATLMLRTGRLDERTLPLIDYHSWDCKQREWYAEQVEDERLRGSRAEFLDLPGMMEEALGPNNYEVHALGRLLK